MKSLKQAKGITLVALVVTIIILIILATISIRMVIGEGGLIWQANNAKIEYRAATVDEEVLAWKAEKQMAKYTTGITPQERNDLIADQLKRGLLTEDEAKTATETGQVKIGSRVIDYGEDTSGGSSVPSEDLSISLDETEVIIGVDDKLTIIATTIPENKEVTWTSSDDNLVSVENNGVITAKLSGTVIITASINNDKGETKEATCQVEAKSRFSEKYGKTKKRDGGTATIPEGYAVGISSDVNSEGIGLVITDEIETVGANHYSTGNEFVWVPVPNIDDMAKLQKNSQTNWEGRLYDFQSDETKGSTSTEKTNYGVTTNNYGEPTIVSQYGQYDASSTNLNKIEEGLTKEEFDTQLQDEFNGMVASVKQYKGFYIGRYETSDLKTGTPKVQANQAPTTSIDWYTMYKNSKGIAKEGSSVISSMIWGCQWDAVMNWFIKCGGETAKYVTDSTGKGNHYKTQGGSLGIIPSGSNSAYRVNNIYDMAGNVGEWTMEAGDYKHRRVFRGGFYSSSSSKLISGSRAITHFPDDDPGYVGSRCVLCINVSAE